MTQFESISSSELSIVCGGQGPAAPQQPQQPQQRPAADYSTGNGPAWQQSGRAISNAADAYQGARKAGASMYESIGNAAIGLFNLGGGFDRNGQPR
jgi:hypothetical protein